MTAISLLNRLRRRAADAFARWSEARYAAWRDHPDSHRYF